MYCKMGPRSRMGASILNNHGFEGLVITESGGSDALAKEENVSLVPYKWIICYLLNEINGIYIPLGIFKINLFRQKTHLTHQAQRNFKNIFLIKMSFISKYFMNFCFSYWDIFFHIPTIRRIDYRLNFLEHNSHLYILNYFYGCRMCENKLTFN